VKKKWGVIDMMKFLMLSFLISFNTQAFEGLWVGEGISKTHRSERACSEIYLEFDVNANYVTLLQGGYICGILQAEYPSSRFERRTNHELWYGGQRVGFFDGQVLRLERPSDFFQLELYLQGEKIIYRELWDDGNSFLQIDGELKLF
jgi:hypothetical protein